MAMSRLRVFICGPISDAGRMPKKMIDSHRWVAIQTRKDLGRAGFSPYCDPAIYDDCALTDETFPARAFEEACAWIQTSDIFLRLPGKCIQADQREYFAESKEILIVRSVKELLTKMEG